MSTTPNQIKRPVGRPLNNDIILDRIHGQFGDKYDTSLVNYEGSDKAIVLICPEHGEFNIIANQIKRSKGCPKCTYNTFRMPVETFIERSNIIHNNKYDYSKVIYKNNRTKVIVICPEHGEWQIVPSAHISGCGCPKCGIIKNMVHRDEFIDRANEVHNNYFDYSKMVYINTTQKIEIVCPKHGSFWQRPSKHLAGRGCPVCSMSKGERDIKRWLDNNGAFYKMQYKIDDCVFVHQLRFDFAVFTDESYSILDSLIEYDGEQHYRSIDPWGGDDVLQGFKERDEAKNVYCTQNNLNLIRIPYWERENIPDILRDSLSCYKEPING